ncbi:MAG TPA: class I SAM-dependent methyltransferase [Candidatus Bathyarchaeia archaeon]|nr:class I SAM-dependent methyltransferase [Candidatus Bathyarchaeia archaeon]
MSRPLPGEDERLRWAWDRYTQEHLDSYLVSGVEDPRINFQSILTRALIADSLFSGRFDALIDAEWRFGLCLTWLLERLRNVPDGWSILDHLENRDEAQCPHFLIETYHALQHDDCPIPDYISQALSNFLAPALVTCVPALSVFERLWNETLARCPEAFLSVLEAGCGSANDYRFIVSHGLAGFVRYTGFDISAKNIANARRRFPDVDFTQASVFDIPAETGEYEYVFAHDLFEHLSPPAFDKALSEVLRVAKKEVWLSFFNMDDIPNHEFHDVGKYHLNRLSVNRTVEFMLEHASHVDVVDIPRLVSSKFGYGAYYNQRARTLIVTV